jgi:hypothetical protein
MTPWRWVRNLRPAGLIFYGVFGALLLVLIGFPFLFPRGIPVGGPASEEGLLTVGEGGWDRAHFEPRMLLIENEALRRQGRYKSNVNSCIDPGALRPLLDRALGEARKDRGTRGLWVKLTATTHWGSTPCIQSIRTSTRRGRQYGSYYRIVSVQSVQPLGCGSLSFVINKRRCPAPPQPPKPLHIDDPASYPAEALSRAAEGRVTIEALIGPKEELLECKPVTTSGDVALDRSACEVFAANIRHYAGRGSTAGLASGVRRIRTRIRFELDRVPPSRSTPSLGE